MHSFRISGNTECQPAQFHCSYFPYLHLPYFHSKRVAVHEPNFAIQSTFVYLTFQADLAILLHSSNCLLRLGWILTKPLTSLCWMVIVLTKNQNCILDFVLWNILWATVR